MHRRRMSNEGRENHKLNRGYEEQTQNIYRGKDTAETEVCNRGKVPRKSLKKGECYPNE